MSNLFRLPNRRHTAEQAAEWVVAMQEGLSQEQRDELHRWLQADPTHAEALLRIADHWDAFDALAELSETFPLARRARQAPQRSTFKVAAVAAIAFVTSGLAVTSVYLWKGHGRATQGPQSVEARVGTSAPDDPQRLASAAEFTSRNYHTTVGKRLSTALPDGSAVTLNTDTSLDIEYSASHRLITLSKGEAIFRVAHNPSRPFQVQVGGRIVQALGTVFNVMLGSQDDLRVTVSEGTVKVVDPDPPRTPGATPGAAHPELLVRAGEQAVIHGGGGQVRHLEIAQIEAKDAWQRGVLVYQGDPLDAVIADVSRYTTVRFSITDKSIRARRVGGVFRAGDVDGLLLALRESFGIEAHREGNVIFLTASR